MVEACLLSKGIIKLPTTTILFMVIDYFFPNSFLTAAIRSPVWIILQTNSG